MDAFVVTYCDGTRRCATGQRGTVDVVPLHRSLEHQGASAVYGDRFPSNTIKNQLTKSQAQGKSSSVPTCECYFAGISYYICVSDNGMQFNPHLGAI